MLSTIWARVGKKGGVGWSSRMWAKLQVCHKFESKVEKIVIQSQLIDKRLWLRASTHFSDKASGKKQKQNMSVEPWKRIYLFKLGRFSDVTDPL